jgi:hypothetical protein
VKANIFAFLTSLRKLWFRSRETLKPTREIQEVRAILEYSPEVYTKDEQH